MESLGDAARRLLQRIEARTQNGKTVSERRIASEQIQESGTPQPLVEPGERRPRTGSTTQARRSKGVAPAKWLVAANDNSRVHAVAFLLEGTRVV